ncbi:ATP-binding protein [Candidatus Uabimicrobium sp. HlEnr_7]|uniref:ATP-binding response regulator n=1 Tax=Candidatus Uabimicrobium helgolandensis TaxID=3095367 RepID=UPI0035576266
MPSPLILVVDKDKTLHNLLQTQLAEKYEVTCTDNYDKIIELVQQFQPRYIIIDVGQDNLSQIDTIKEVYNNPIIAMSECNEESFVVELIKRDVFAFVRKPIFVDSLSGYLKDGLDFDNFKWSILSGFERWLEIEIPSNSNYINAYCSFIVHLMPEFKYKQMMMYAVRELIQNGIEHGNKYCKDSCVNICFIKTQTLIMFMIKDQGTGFNMELLPHAVIGPQKKNPMDVLQYRKSMGMRPGGLGIHSVSRIADELIYNEKGNSVTMIKNIANL